jgi:membrane-associated phospholipid phosphatase
MELNFLLWLQSFATPWLDTIMGAITQLGSEYFYLAAISVLYWCVDVKATLRLFVLTLTGVYVGGAIKVLTAELRPFQAYPSQIHPRFTSTAEDASFPSAHAMNSTVFWGYLSLMLRRRWLYIVAPIIVLLVGFSRLYLGLHWPHDVLWGLIFGLIVVGIGYAIFRLLDVAPISVKFPVTLVLCLLPLGLFALLPNHSTAQSMGALFGAALGHLLERQYVHFPVRRAWWQQALKLIIGLAGAGLLFLGLRGILPPLQTSVDYFLVTPATNVPAVGNGLVEWASETPTLLRYALLGLWCTLGAPAIFRLLFGKEKGSK